WEEWDREIENYT
nr:Chain C, ENVELOPE GLYCOPROTEIN GP41 [Human immunodeficiency virus]1GZL_D Chain D, ENVELOPE GLYCOPROTEIN GP41 [Human immunodeficiency virus]